jgi:heme-degrading monooxygenase HmoA
MAINRIIHCVFPADQADQAIENWKQHCAPLMIRQPGCRSEMLLRSTDNRGEFLSYSEWDDMAAVERYLASEDHQEIKRHNRNIEGAQVTVTHYQPVG